MYASPESFERPVAVAHSIRTVRYPARARRRLPARFIELLCLAVLLGFLLSMGVMVGQALGLDELSQQVETVPEATALLPGPDAQA